MPMERWQILLRAEQAAHLRELARVQGVPVVELVQEAINQAFPHPRAPLRRASWARFNALLVVPGGPAPEALEALLDTHVDKLIPRADRRARLHRYRRDRLHPLRRTTATSLHRDHVMGGRRASASDDLRPRDRRGMASGISRPTAAAEGYGPDCSRTVPRPAQRDAPAPPNRAGNRVAGSGNGRSVARGGRHRRRMRRDRDDRPYLRRARRPAPGRSPRHSRRHRSRAGLTLRLNPGPAVSLRVVASG